MHVLGGVSGENLIEPERFAVPLDVDEVFDRLPLFVG